MLHCDMKDTASYKSTLACFAVQSDKQFLPAIKQKSVTFFKLFFSTAEIWMSERWCVVVISCQAPAAQHREQHTMPQYVVLLCVSLFFIYSACYGCVRICFQLNAYVSCFVHEYLNILFTSCQVKCFQNVSPEFYWKINFLSFVDVCNVNNFIYIKYRLIVFTEVHILLALGVCTKA